LAVQIPDKATGDHEKRPPKLHGGGTAANTAVALARLGVTTSFVGAIGDDGYGRFAKNSLEQEGIDTADVVAVPAFTSVVLALVDPHGERTLFGWPPRGAAHTKLEPAQITPTIIEPAAWLHTTGMCLVQSPSRDALLKGMELARVAEIPVSFDLNIRLGFENGQLPPAFVDYLKRAIELATIVLGSASDELIHLAPATSAEESARKLAGAERLVIARLGAAGAMAVTADYTLSVSAFPTQVVDTIGAGDAFNAGFITACIEGKDVSEALRWGSAVAALTIGKAGARGVPHRPEVETLLTNQ